MFVVGQRVRFKAQNDFNASYVWTVTDTYRDALGGTVDLEGQGRTDSMDVAGYPVLRNVAAEDVTLIEQTYRNDGTNTTAYFTD